MAGPTTRPAAGAPSTSPPMARSTTAARARGEGGHVKIVTPRASSQGRYRLREQERLRERGRRLAGIRRPLVLPLEADHVADAAYREKRHLRPLRRLVDTRRLHLDRHH